MFYLTHQLVARGSPNFTRLSGTKTQKSAGYDVTFASGWPQHAIKYCTHRKYNFWWANLDYKLKRIVKQKCPPIAGAVRNATSLIPQRLPYIMLAITFCENVCALPCIDSHGRIDCDNNMTRAIYVMQRSIKRENRSRPTT